MGSMRRRLGVVLGLVTFSATVAVVAVAGTACQRRGAGAPAATGTEAGGAAARPHGAGSAGTTCGGRDDCTSDQVCVDHQCRFRTTSVAGEILGAAAAAQLEAGDLAGAGRTFDQALAAYEAADAPVPPEILCGAASTAIRSATSAEAREEAAKRADACFRSSLPGQPARVDVARALARLRYDGLDLDRFDRDDRNARYFSKQPSRPTIDAIEIAIDVPERDHSGFAALAEALRGELAQRAIADCFVQFWELRHERQAQASLVLRYSTRLRDMGDYDVFEPEVEVTHSSMNQEGFDVCLAGALTGTLGPGPRASRIVAWQEPFEVAARLQ